MSERVRRQHRDWRVFHCARSTILALQRRLALGSIAPASRPTALGWNALCGEYNIEIERLFRMLRGNRSLWELQMGFVRISNALDSKLDFPLGGLDEN